MSFVYTPAKKLILQADIDFLVDTFKLIALKVAASTTCDTEKDKTTVSGFTTLGEISATSYVRKTLASLAVNQDDPNLRAEFDVADVTWTAIGGASNDTIGAFLLIKFVTNDADSIPIAYIDNAGSSFAQATNGSDITATINVEGLLQAT